MGDQYVTSFLCNHDLIWQLLFEWWAYLFCMWVPHSFRCIRWPLFTFADLVHCLAALFLSFSSILVQWTSGTPTYSSLLAVDFISHWFNLWTAECIPLGALWHMVTCWGLLAVYDLCAASMNCLFVLNLVFSIPSGPNLMFMQHLRFLLSSRDRLRDMPLSK